MARNVQHYDHFCFVARALEQVGDRWTLLVVRDLVHGPRRFTDLAQRLGGITPKTLTTRLRELEESGIVAVDRQAGRREVFYRLTPAGDELAQVVDALGSWGARHVGRPWREGEPLHGEHLLAAITRSLNAAAVDGHGAVWAFRLDDGDYVITHERGRWVLELAAPPTDADVTFTGSSASLARAVFGGDALQADGGPSDVQRFRALLGSVGSV